MKNIYKLRGKANRVANLKFNDLNKAGSKMLKLFEKYSTVGIKDTKTFIKEL